MYNHVRKQYNRFSFRLSVLGKYVDAGDSFETEELAAFAADVAKHFLRVYYFIDLKPSLDGEVFCMLAYRHSVTLSDRSSVESALSPGVKVFLDANRATLDAHAEANRPERKPWEVLRSNTDPAVRQWCNECDSASLKAEAFARVNGEYLSSLLGAISARLVECDGPAARALKMHEKTDDPELMQLRADLRQLRSHLANTAEYVIQLASAHATRRAEVASALAALEPKRPLLT